MCEYWHSKSITKPKLELEPHLVLKLDILSESAFYKKRYIGPLSFKWHLGNLCSYDSCRAGLYSADFGHSWVPGHL